MSDMSVSSRDNQRQQTEDYKREQEQKLQSLRGEYQRRESAIRESGDAAVSHLKKNTEERLDVAREEARERLRGENDQINKDYGSMRRRTAQQSQALEAQAEQVTDRSQREIAAAESNENRVINRTQEELKDYLHKQQELRGKSQEGLDRDLREQVSRANQKLGQAKLAERTELSDLEKKHRLQVEDFHSRTRSDLEDTRQQAEIRLRELREKDARAYEKERHEGADSVQAVRARAHDAVVEERDGNRKELEAVRVQHESELAAERDRALHTNEKLLKTYSGETQRIETQGEATVSQKQEKFDKLLREQESFNKEKLKDSETDFEMREEKTHKEQQARANEELRKTAQALESQKTGFKHRYDLNEKTNRESLSNQKEAYLKALYKEKTRFDKQISTEKSRVGDPFYAVKDFGAKLEERPGGYFLSASVAPYDRDTVEVKVKDDKITLTARRSYENTIGDENARTQTSSFQTYKQEFKLDVPVSRDSAVTRVSEGGEISVFVPKKGSGPKTV